MIKKIHYCWFGCEKPDSVKRNVEHWAMLNPDFEICEWNESNIDVSEYEFGRRALAAKKWGFLVDIIRPQKLFYEGGFYIDADVELINPLSILTNESDKLIMGYMYGCALGTAILYSPAGHPYIKEILNSYKYIHPNLWPVSNTIFTAYFINNVSDFLLTGKTWENDLCHVYPKEFFEQPSFIKAKGMSIHHCCGSWSSVFKNNFSINPRMSWLSHIIKWASRKRRTWLSARNNEFTGCYKAALRGERKEYDISHLYSVDNPYCIE